MMGKRQLKSCMCMWILMIFGETRGCEVGLFLFRIRQESWPFALVKEEGKATTL